uniref:Uncharacterized protein n=1 Tax=viral metagenome TaxID=1070528 RepID=A0A6C0F2Q1_9ZZZZ
MNFDLNIQNYNKQELENLFDLTKNYSSKDLHEKEEKLRKTIVSNVSITENMRTKIISFLNEAKNTIIFNNIQQSSNDIPNLVKPIPNVSELKGIYKDIYNLDTTLKASEVTSSGGTFLIEPKVTAYGQSSPSEFYQGVINPLNKRIIKQCLNIDTRFRENYFNSQSTNFHIDLPIRFSKVVSMQLASFEAPSSQFVFSKVLGNNFFAIRINDIEEVITINDGNYSNSFDFITYLNQIFASIGGDFEKIQVSQDLYHENGSGRIIFSSKDSSVNFSLNFQTDRNGNLDKATPLPLKLGWALGFRLGYYENTNTTPTNPVVSYVGEGLLDLQGPRYMYLVVDDHNNNVNNGFYSAFNSSILNNNILARISLQGPSDLTIQNNLSMITNTRQYFGPVDIQKLNIQLIDEYGRIINLNNMDYSFCLNLQTIYDL